MANLAAIAKKSYAFVMGLVGVLALSSCAVGLPHGDAHSGGDSGESKAVPIAAPMPEPPAGLEIFYRQGVSWRECGESLECGHYTVPLNYADPKGAVLRIAVTKHVARGKKIGSLLVNPGGPGESGQELAQAAGGFLPESVVRHFDIIGFDPRGVGESQPVDCVSDEQLLKFAEASHPRTAAGKAASKLDAEKFVAGCMATSGKKLAYISTENTARDMDVMRAVQGDPKLYYLGYSYGTELGAEYAQLFPKNVGRMVLDGAVAATKTNFEQTRDQMVGFEKSFDAYLRSCLPQKGKCPFSGSLEQARAKVAELFARALQQPFRTSDPQRPLTQSALLYGIITPLYSANYLALSQAFTDLIQRGDGSAFQVLFDSYLGREDGKFTGNAMEANIVINCADYPVEGDAAQWAREEAELVKVAPLFGPVFGYDELTCSLWPTKPSKRVGPFVASGSDPIVVVGTSGDPATPYEWAQDLAKSLENSRLITWQGSGHTAYGRSTRCVSDPINAYLLSGVVPKNGLVCPAQ
ncbi:MAG: alpha/beta hydrolase [Arcanobacterium sp.]|nr:alpha/beta hydrolase [Arcanobacterium sp.]MDY5589755.1 alpha/beta hydrolase [Arcanobacterium sp.]